jgi:hypothetical protein
MYITEIKSEKKGKKYKSKYSSKPHVAFKIFEDYYYSKGVHARRVAQSKIEIREPETDEVLCTGKIRYISFDQFKTSVRSEINSLAEKCLEKWLDKHPAQ